MVVLNDDGSRDKFTLQAPGFGIPRKARAPVWIGDDPYTIIEVEYAVSRASSARAASTPPACTSPPDQGRAGQRWRGGSPTRCAARTSSRSGHQPEPPPVEATSSDAAAARASWWGPPRRGTQSDGKKLDYDEPDRNDQSHERAHKIAPDETESRFREAEIRARYPGQYDSILVDIVEM